MRPFANGRIFYGNTSIREREDVLVLIIATIIANYGTTPGFNGNNNRRK